MRKLVTFLICVVCLWFSIPSSKRRTYYACESYLDYYLPKLFNPKCSYNADVGRTSPRIIIQNGFKVKKYKVETDDGFILDVIRICNNETFKKGVVYLQHPYSGDSKIFIDKGRNMSLGLLLVDKGYDVWMGNSRGTKLTLDHKKWLKGDPRYWDFSFHEIAIYDLPASLRLVKRISGVDKITYLGYSAGGTASLIYASLLKDHAKDTINLFITIAPSSYMNHIAFPGWFAAPAIYFLKFLADTYGEENYIQTIAALFRIGAYSPFLLTMMTDTFQFNPKQKHPPWFPLVAHCVLQSANSKQLMHYRQMERAKSFQMYDYGPQTNKKMYGKERPPEYPVSRIEVPFQIIYSAYDAFFEKEDAWLLYSKMRGITKKYQPYSPGNFNHIDFMYGNGIGDFYDWIIKRIDMLYTQSDNKVLVDQ